MGLDESKRKGDRAWHRQWMIPLILAVFSVLIMLGGEEFRNSLRFDRVWIANGETWRLLSGHVSHLGWSHFALNGVGLALVWYLVGARYTDWEWVIIIGLTLLAIDTGFLFLNPELFWYVGLSGLLHGLLAAGIVARVHPIDSETAILLLLLVGKLAWEQFAGPIPGSEATSGGPVVVDAHLYGALGGLVGALLTRIRVLRRASI